MCLYQQLTEYVSACFTAIWVESHEHDDALREIAQMCHDQDWRLATWDVDAGLQVPGDEQPADAGGSDPLAAIRSINRGHFRFPAECGGSVRSHSGRCRPRLIVAEILYPDTKSIASQHFPSVVIAL
jgi:hypothetical protein